MNNPLISALVQGLKSSPDNIPLKLALADAYIKDQEWQLALTLLQEIIASESGHIDALNKLIDLATKLEQTDLIVAYQALLQAAQPAESNKQTNKARARINKVSRF